MTPEMIASLPANQATSEPEIWRDESAAPTVPLAPQFNFNNHQNTATPANDPFNPASRPGGDLGLHGGNFLIPKTKGTNILSHGFGLSKSRDVETPTANGGVAVDQDIAMGGIAAENYLSGEEPPPAPVRRTRTLQRLGLDPSKDMPRMRPPTLRSHVKSSSEIADPEDGSVALPQRIPSNTHKRTVSGHVSQSSTLSGQDPAADAPPRRSNRLFSQITGSKSTRTVNGAATDAAKQADRELKKARATGTKGRSAVVGRVVSGNRKVLPPEPGELKESRAPSRGSANAPPPLQKPAAPKTAHEQEALEMLLSLFRKIGQGYHALSSYDCQRSVDAFRSLPPQHLDTPWILSHLGKAYYEKADYLNAEQVFARILKLAPSQTQDMELYSTVLWHLKRDAHLAFLSHTLRDVDFYAPQTWCALGNSFSLAREHDQAITCFRRATQLDEKFAYAYTLMGHEHVANEEFERALEAYRSAVGVDRRHYNGWYGLGKCYERMGRLEAAEQHYRAAARINPGNAVLVVCIGVVLEKLKRPTAALTYYAQACELDPKSALARFKKARALMNLRRQRDALAELEVLKDIAPDEANVFFLLGRLHKSIGNKGEAIKCFTTALNLDPKASNFIKEAMESLDDSEDERTDDDDI
ncbi:anaphase-promoting complex subunit cdc27 [Elasticomyces elasticus]|nr:anaphase-promoting complex subunit cdc27 [Elasticomyces elasticus]KAK4989345.1 anaphase-promoting complex subunit cdc27 [Elasticomyces elasticus]